MDEKQRIAELLNELSYNDMVTIASDIWDIVSDRSVDDPQNFAEALADWAQASSDNGTYRDKE